MSWLEWLVPLIIFINTITAFITVFYDDRDISSTWAWLLVLVLLPVVGFVMYLFIGKKISRDNIFDLKTQERLGLKTSSDEQKRLLKAGKLGEHNFVHSLEVKELISLFLMTEDSLYTDDNQLTMYTDGQDKFTALLTDIAQAKKHIHLQYFIFKNDELGKRVMSALVERAQAGVEVLVLYDALGSRTLKPGFFKSLKKAGGQAMPFFGSNVPFVNLRFNYRNHRKLVIIDGQIGYIGGFNIGNEYLGEGKLGYWRDTHLRIQGSAVHSLQTRFFVDWNAVVPVDEQREYAFDYFPVPSVKGTTAMQIVSSGPDSDWAQIKLGFLKTIYAAKETIYIQTPYFIPDESILDALRIAIMSGIQVHIMIPDKPDHPVVYRASEYYVKLCQQLGAHVYIYENGFIHAKVMIVDGKLASVGTANFDIRSFKLNFEVSAFIYDATIAQQLEQAFVKDKQQSRKLDAAYFQKQSAWRKFKQKASRLFSPIL